MPRNRSHQTHRLFETMRSAPTNELWGLEIVRRSGVSAATTYGILRRLEDEGLVKSRWEILDPQSAGRPPRRYYRLTVEGERVAERETSGQRQALRLLIPGWKTP